MKDYLRQLAKEVNYAALIERAEKNSHTTVWGVGVLLAYSPEPYGYELQGLKRGKFLKKNGRASSSSPLLLKRQS